jgi:hypothetical protein
VTPRERLPNRWASIVFEIELYGLRYTASASYFADGRPAGAPSMPLGAALDVIASQP